MVYAADLKSVAQKACGFESHSRYHTSLYESLHFNKVSRGMPTQYESLPNAKCVQRALDLSRSEVGHFLILK